MVSLFRRRDDQNDQQDQNDAQNEGEDGFTALGIDDEDEQTDADYVDEKNVKTTPIALPTFEAPTIPINIGMEPPRREQVTFSGYISSDSFPSDTEDESSDRDEQVTDAGSWLSDNSAEQPDETGAIEVVESSASSEAPQDHKSEGAQDEESSEEDEQAAYISRAVENGMKQAMSQLIPSIMSGFAQMTPVAIGSGLKKFVEHERELLIDLLAEAQLRADAMREALLPKPKPYNERHHIWALIRSLVVPAFVMFVAAVLYGLAIGRLGGAVVGFIFVAIIAVLSIYFTIDKHGLLGQNLTDDKAELPTIKKAEVPAVEKEARKKNKWAKLPAILGISLSCFVYGGLMLTISPLEQPWRVVATVGYFVVLGGLAYWMGYNNHQFKTIYKRVGSTMIASRDKSDFFFTQSLYENFDLVDFVSGSMSKTGYFAELFGCFNLTLKINSNESSKTNVSFWENLKDMRDGKYLLEVFADGRTQARREQGLSPE